MFSRATARWPPNNKKSNRKHEKIAAIIDVDCAVILFGHQPLRKRTRFWRGTELLRRYAPLEGIITKSRSDILPEPGCGKPVENTLAPHATVAPNDSSPWHGATVAQHSTVASGATLARYDEVKGEWRVPNTINFSLFPTLDPFAKAVYYQLFLLSHGFKCDRCIVGLAKLATMVLMSLRKVQDTVAYLEKRGLIKRLGSAFGGTSKGN